MMNILRIVVSAIWISHFLIAYSLDNVKINEFMASNIHMQLNPDYSDFED